MVAGAAAHLGEEVMGIPQGSQEAVDALELGVPALLQLLDVIRPFRLEDVHRLVGAEGGADASGDG